MLVIINYGYMPPQRLWLNISTIGSMATHPCFGYLQLYFSLIVSWESHYEVSYLRTMWRIAMDTTVVYALSLSGPWSPQIQYNKYHLCCWLCEANAVKAQSLSISTGRHFRSALLRAQGLQDPKTGSGKAVYLVLDSRIYCKTVSPISDFKMTGNMLRLVRWFSR